MSSHATADGRRRAIVGTAPNADENERGSLLPAPSTPAAVPGAAGAAVRTDFGWSTRPRESG